MFIYVQGNTIINKPLEVNSLKATAGSSKPYRKHLSNQNPVIATTIAAEPQGRSRSNRYQQVSPNTAHPTQQLPCSFSCVYDFVNSKISIIINHLRFCCGHACAARCKLKRMHAAMAAWLVTLALLQQLATPCKMPVSSWQLWKICETRRQLLRKLSF